MEFVYNAAAASQAAAPPRDTAPEAGAGVQESGGFRQLMDQKRQELSAETGERAETESPLGGETPPAGGTGAEEDRMALGAQMLLSALSAVQFSIRPAGEGPAPEDAVAALASLPTAEPAAAEAAVIQPQAPAPDSASAPQGPIPQAGEEASSAPLVWSPEAGASERQGPAAAEDSPGPARDGPVPPERRAEDTRSASASPEPEAPLFRGVEAAPVKVGSGPEPPRDGAAAPVERQVLQRLETAVELGEPRVKISLRPESLGSVTVELTRTGDGALRVLLHADSPRTQSLLERSAGGLQSLLAESARSEVQVQVERRQEDQQSRQNLYDQGGRGGQPQQEQSRQRQRQPDEAFLQQLRLGLIPLTAEAS